MKTKFDNKQHHGRGPKFIKRVAVNAITEKTKRKNSEYRELRKFLGKRALPYLQF